MSTYYERDISDSLYISKGKNIYFKAKLWIIVK